MRRSGAAAESVIMRGGQSWTLGTRRRRRRMTRKKHMKSERSHPALSAVVLNLIRLPNLYFLKDEICSISHLPQGLSVSGPLIACFRIISQLEV